MSPKLNRADDGGARRARVSRRRRRARAHRRRRGLDRRHGPQGVLSRDRGERARRARARRSAKSYGWWRRLRWYQKPTIAMVNGWCFGGGYGPLFACDLAFAAEEAQFGLSEINWGILPGGGATKVARELMTFRNAMYHALTGEAIDGTQGGGMGLRQRGRSAAKLKARVEDVAKVLLDEESGRAQGDEGRHSPRRRDDLRRMPRIISCAPRRRRTASTTKAARKASASSSTRRASSPASAPTTARAPSPDAPQ